MNLNQRRKKWGLGRVVRGLVAGAGVLLGGVFPLSASEAGSEAVDAKATELLERLQEEERLQELEARDQNVCGGIR